MLSHPQTALHAALGGALIFIFYGRNKRGFISALLAGIGVTLLTAPWWGTVFSRYGLQPFFPQAKPASGLLSFILRILKFDGLGDYLFIPTLLFAFIGLWITFKQREFFLITWAVLAYLDRPARRRRDCLVVIVHAGGDGFAQTVRVDQPLGRRPD